MLETIPDAPAPLSEIAPSRLRQYYAKAMSGARPHELYAGLPFAQVWALLRIDFPGIDAGGVVRRLPRYAKLRAQVPATAQAREPQASTSINHRESVNIADIPCDVERLVLQNVRHLSGLESFGGLTRLQSVTLRAIGDVHQPPEGTRATPLQELWLDDVQESAANALLSCLAPRTLTLCVSRLPLHLSRWSIPGTVASAHFSSEIEVLDFDAIASLRLERLGIVRPSVAQGGFEQMLATSLAGPLAELTLLSHAPMGIAPLNNARMLKLKRITITVHAEQRDELLSLAVERSNIAWRLQPPLPPPRRVRPNQTQGSWTTYRGVPIASKSRNRPSIESDLAEIVGYGGDNGMLEDALRKQVKTGITWGSESGTLVARSTTLRALQKVVDAAFELAGSASSSAPTGRPRRRQRTQK